MFLVFFVPESVPVPVPVPVVPADLGDPGNVEERDHANTGPSRLVTRAQLHAGARMSNVTPMRTTSTPRCSCPPPGPRPCTSCCDARRSMMLTERVGGEAAFQLIYNGRYMRRRVGKNKETRVRFKPDDWQKKLLDIVDSRESALVVAPTASGKTFICYYTMEQILRHDNDGIAVYVAPTKALVNQVSAEIFARFGSKDYGKSDKQLLGVFQREFNSAGGIQEQGLWINSQVLVTIPHVLEGLLMSAEKYSWVKRLRYVVMDEVHCIGESEGGALWERVIQALPCPYLALSATVSNPLNFHGWLSKIAASG